MPLKIWTLPHCLHSIWTFLKYIYRLYSFHNYGTLDGALIKHSGGRHSPKNLRQFFPALWAQVTPPTRGRSLFPCSLILLWPIGSGGSDIGPGPAWPLNKRPVTSACVEEAGRCIWRRFEPGYGMITSLLEAERRRADAAGATHACEWRLPGLSSLAQRPQKVQQNEWPLPALPEK